METKEYKEYLMFGMIALVLIIAVVQSFQIKAMKTQISANVVASNGNGIDMSGWSEDEKMMYEHHGTLPARLQGSDRTVLSLLC